MSGPVTASLHSDSTSTTAFARSALPIVLCLLMGISAHVRTEQVLLSLTPAFLLPIAATWWARHEGSRVALPLALLSLVPYFSFDSGGLLSLEYGFPEAACLMSAGCALSFGNDAAPKLLAAAVRPRWKLPLSALMFTMLLAGTPLGHLTRSAGGIVYTFNALAAPALVGLLLAIDWRCAAAAIARRPSAWAPPIAALTFTAFLVQVDVSTGPMSFRVGNGSGSGLVSALCFIGVLCGWITLRRAAAALTFAAVLVQFGVVAAGPMSQWLDGERPVITAVLLFGQAFAAALVGAVFRKLRSMTGSDAQPLGELLGERDVVLIASAIVLVIAATALGQHGIVLWGASVWVIGAASMLIGWARGDRGVVAAPLGVFCGVCALALVLPVRDVTPLLYDLSTLVSASLAYALAGRSFARASRALPPAAPFSGKTLLLQDLTAVARAVQWIDNAAVLQSFAAALLVLSILAFALAQLAVGLLPGRDPLSDLRFAVIGLIAAFFLLTFVFGDWVNRVDGLRPLSGLSAGLLILLGAGVASAILEYLLMTLSKGFSDQSRWLAGGALLAALTGLHAWMRARLAIARGVAIATVSLASLVVLFGTFMLVQLERSHPLRLAVEVIARLAAPVIEVLRQVVRPLAWVWSFLGFPDAFVYFLFTVPEMLFLFVAIGLMIALWVRAVRLRLVLCEDWPRNLIFGELPAGRFWPRIAALLGMPASLWRGSALREPSAWALLLARPLVYAGFLWAEASLLPGLLVIATGHAAFVGGKRLAARRLWRPRATADDRAPILFLRSFEDDQFEFRRGRWQLRLRWFDLWSFRRNVDETLIDDIAQYGPVVALGRPGESAAPFGAARHYATNEDWQTTVTETALRARAIVLVAGMQSGLRTSKTSGLEWECHLLRREKLLDRTVLLLHPDPARDSSNRQTIQWLFGAEDFAVSYPPGASARPIAVVPTPIGPHVLTVEKPSAAAYLVALRAHFQGLLTARLESALQ